MGPRGSALEDRVCCQLYTGNIAPWVSGRPEFEEGCAVIDGTIFASDFSADELRAQASSVVVRGDVSVTGTASVVDLSAFDRFEVVEGNLLVSANTALTSLSGLERLVSIGGDLTLEDNSSLCEDAATELVTREDLVIG